MYRELYNGVRVPQKPPSREEREERKEKRASVRDSERTAGWRGGERDLQPSPAISLRANSARNTDSVIGKRLWLQGTGCLCLLPDSG